MTGLRIESRVDSLFAAPQVLPRVVDVEGELRAEYERHYYDWLLAALADAVRQVMLSTVMPFETKRDRVLELLDAIEDVQVEVVARL